MIVEVFALVPRADVEEWTSDAIAWTYSSVFARYKELRRAYG